MAITNSKFEYGVSGQTRLLPGAISNNGFEYGISAIQPKSNVFPKPVELLSPIAGERADSIPTFIFKIKRDANGDDLHAELHISKFNDLKDATIFSSANNHANWEYYDKLTEKWVSFTSKGVPDAALITGDTDVRFTPEVEIEPASILYWGAKAYDLKDYSRISEIRSFKSAKKLSLELQSPIETSINAEKIIVAIHAKIPTDGETPAEQKVFVTNNGLDEEPVWEDATEAVFRKQSYVFQNSSKTASTWAVNVRYEILANDSLGDIAFYGMGLSFK